MPLKPVSLDHVNIFVRNAARSHQWYTDILGLHTQDIFYHPGTEKMRAAFLACDPDHAHDRSEEHTSELQSHSDLVCRLLLEKKKQQRRRQAQALAQFRASSSARQRDDLSRQHA